MSDTADPELCSLITNVYKPPKHFDFPKIDQRFRCVWFEVFSWVCCSRWEYGTYCRPCVLFGYKNVEKSLQKIISNMAKNTKMFQQNTKKEKYYFINFCVNIFLPPPFVEWGELKIPKNWVGGGNQGEFGGQRGNMNFVGVMGFFHFSLLICKANEWDGNAVNAIVTLA